jgi:hypothetical protein
MLKKVMDIYTDTIVPMIEPETWHFVIGTPWNFSDIIAHCRSSEIFVHLFTPAYEEDNVTPVWPEKWSVEELDRKRKEIKSEIGFARMYYLDLEKTRGLTLKKEWLGYWPHSELIRYGEEWPVVIGVDYTSTSDPTRQRGDYFALGVGKAIPGGKGIVIYDGVRVKVPKAEAISHVVSWAARYKYLAAIGIEAIITGNEFYNDMLNNAELRAVGVSPLPVRFRKSKGYRFEQELASLFKHKRIYLSDRADCEFINAFKDEWLNWQGDKLEGNYTNDTLDAVYAMVMNDMGKAFATPIGKQQYDVTNPMYPSSEKEECMWDGFGRN